MFGWLDYVKALWGLVGFSESIWWVWVEISKTLQLSSDFLVHFVVVDASLGWILVCVGM